MTTLLAFDPGLTTGWAFCYYTPTSKMTILDRGNADFHEMNLIVRKHSPDHLVVEKFTLSAGNDYTADLTGVQVEGALRFYFGDEMITWQSRSDKSGLSDELQKSMGYWVTKEESGWTDGRDQNDACKHVLIWLRNNKHRPTIEAINPREK